MGFKPTPLTEVVRPRSLGAEIISQLQREDLIVVSEFGKFVREQKKSIFSKTLAEEN